MLYLSARLAALLHTLQHVGSQLSRARRPAPLQFGGGGGLLAGGPHRRPADPEGLQAVRQQAGVPRGLRGVQRCRQEAPGCILGSGVCVAALPLLPSLRALLRLDTRCILDPCHPLPPAPQLEHTTLPKREHGHKQLGKAAAAAHIAQLGLFFALGAAMLGLATPQQPGQARVANATFGILYALQVGWKHRLRWPCCVRPAAGCWCASERLACRHSCAMPPFTCCAWK